MLTFSEFCELSKVSMAEMPGWATRYFQEHNLRLYSTYVVCAKALTAPAKVISLGAGAAFIEHALGRADKHDVTIVDFPDRVGDLAASYKKSGFTVEARDLSQVASDSERDFHLALSSEVIEHIPRPPQEHIRSLANLVIEGGKVVVSTPNFGNSRVIMRLLAHRPVMPPPDRFFGPVCFENEGVHRREYLPSEILDALRGEGLKLENLSFCSNRSAIGLKDRLMGLIDMIPRYRPTMIFLAS